MEIVAGDKSTIFDTGLSPISHIGRLTKIQMIVGTLLISQFLVWTIIWSPKAGLYAVLLVLFLLLITFSLEYGTLAIIIVIPWAWQSIAFQVGSVSIKATYVLISIGFSVLLFKIFIKKDLKWSYTVLDKPFLLFLGIAFMAVTTSIDQAWSIREFLQLIVYAMFYFLIVNVIRSRTSIIRAANIIVIATILPSIIGISGFMEHSISASGVQRIYAGFNAANLSANYLLMGLAVALSLSIAYAGSRKQWLYIVATALLTTSLLLTYSRAGWVVGVIIALIVAYYAKVKLRSIAIVLILAICVSSFSIPLFQERASQIVSADESSNLSHMYVWKSAWYMIISHPILGVGTGAFPRYYAIHEGTSQLPSPYIFGKRVYYESKTYYGVLAHNAILQIWAETGTLGLFAFLLIIGSFLRTMFTSINDAGNHYDRLILIGLLASVLGILLHNLSITNLIDHFWAALGISTASAKVIYQARNEH